MSSTVLILPAEQAHKSILVTSYDERQNSDPPLPDLEPNQAPDMAEPTSNKYHSPVGHVRQVATISTLISMALIAIILQYVPLDTASGIAFISLFGFRYHRFIVNTISWYLAKPYAPAAKRTLAYNDVTVVIPTANPSGPEFLLTVQSALDSGAAAVIIVTFGEKNIVNAGSIIAQLDSAGERLKLFDNGFGNKRAQMIRGVQESSTKITVFCDDHVFWPKGFLDSILAPFEDSQMGGVGMHKQVLRVRHSFWQPNLANFFGCIYLDRHNAEILATNRLDGGVFIISSRTAAYRTDILKDPRFQEGFLNEYIDFPIIGRRGPLNADDDNFIMRWLTNHDKKIWIQNGSQPLMQTTINNSWGTFSQQLLRWVRTTWRSNPRSIMEGKVMRTQPWSFFATNLTLNYNLALVWDPLLIWNLHRAMKNSQGYTSAMTAMILWILFSKIVKLLPFFKRNPADIVLFPVYVLGAYAHSLVKLYALCTAHDVAWGSRKNVDAIAEKSC